MSSATEILPLALGRCETLLSANGRLRDCLHALKQIDDETIIKYAHLFDCHFPHFCHAPMQPHRASPL